MIDHLGIQVTDFDKAAAFYDAVLASSGTSPRRSVPRCSTSRAWPEYHPGYFAAFVRDPDGNTVEAVHHTFE